MRRLRDFCVGVWYIVLIDHVLVDPVSGKRYWTWGRQVPWRWITVAALSGFVIWALLTGWATAATARPAQERPPECHLIHVTNPDGSRFYARACGTGSGGESWVKDAKWSRGLTADGFTITGSDCGTYANPCVVTAPGSPPS